MKKWYKLGILCAFLILFFRNHVFFQTLASKIDRELITPYRQTYNEKFSLSPTQGLLPTIVETITQNPTSTPKPRSAISRSPTSSPKITITEDDLWKALTEYRRDHGKREINRADSLCKYAKKRAEELTARLPAHQEDPLDGHAGFSRDANSGSVFTETGFNNVGENLAYTPGFTSATQIIEWGWDTSSGHRSLQLSDDISHGCLSGIHPIYVGIYAH